MALPSIETETNAVDQTQSAIDKLGKSIMEKASMSIQGATKAIIPNIPKITNDNIRKKTILSKFFHQS